MTTKRPAPKKLTKKRKLLLKTLERIISEVYNPKSTTVTAIEWGRYYETQIGRTYCYSPRFIDKKGNETEMPYLIDRRWDSDPSQDILMSGHYHFGANHMHIFRNLNRLLDYLEQNYGLVIDEPEENNRPT